MSVGSDEIAVELRVLSGFHKGAKELLDADIFVLGNDPECDFVLQDAAVLPRQLCLERQGSEWVSRPALAGEAESEQWGQAEVVSLRELFWCGPVVLSLSAPQTDWPSDELVSTFLADCAEDAKTDVNGLTPLEEPAEELSMQETLTGHDDSMDGDSQSQSNELHEQTLSKHSRTRMPRFASAISIAIGLGVLSVLGWFLLPQEPVAPALVAKPSLEDLPAQRQQAVQAIIDRLGMSDALEVVIRADAAVLVKGEFLDDQRFERLALALSRLTPRPALQIGSETQWLSKLRALVSEASADLKQPLKVISVGGGNYRLRGKVLDRAHEMSLLTSLDKVLPAQMQIESALVFIEDDAMNMLRRLQAARLGEISGLWKAGQLHLDVRLMRKEVQQWERLITRVAPTYDVPFVANLEVLSDQQTVRAETRLPFNLQAIVGGAAPYVVIGSDRLFVDGTRDGWKLVLIDDQVAVFESSPEQRVTVRR